MNKEKRAKRFQQKKRHIDRQTNIYKTVTNLTIEKPHMFHKRKALNCGNPECVMCMNPRKAFGELTMQERRQFQCEGNENDD